MQAGAVAAPRWPGNGRLDRLSGRGWALIPLVSLVAVVFGIRYLSDAATGLTYLALIAVPPLAAGALGWAARGARPWASLAVVPLFFLAWLGRGSLPGQAAAALLCALSCVTLGVLLAVVTPTTWLKVGIVLMAAADTWLVVTNLLQAPNATLIAAHPGGGLPRLQSVVFGSVSMGYGDLFVAALFGAVLAREGRSRGQAALLTLLAAAVFDLLFLALRELPATVPVALVLLGLELQRRLRLSGSRRRPRPGDATPRPAR